MEFKLESLEMTNFRNVGRQILTFSDHRKMTLILSSANGSGKSTVFYALMLCLFPGEKISRYEDYIGFGHKKAQLLLKGSYGSDPFVLAVSLSSSGSKRELTYLDRTYSQDECSNLLKAWGFDDLMASCIFYNGDSQNIVQMTPMERLKELLNLDGTLDKLNRIILKLKDEKRGLELKASELSGKLNALKALVDSDRAKKAGMEASYEGIAERHSKVLAGYSKVFGELNGKLVDLNSKLKGEGIGLRLANAARLAESLASEIESLSKRKSEQERKSDEAIRSLENTIGDEEKILMMEDPESALRDAKDRLQAKRMAKASLESEKALLEKRIEVQRKGICDICGSEIHDDLLNRTLSELESRNEALESLGKQISNIACESEKAKEQADVLHSLEGHRKSLENLKSEKKRMSETYDMMLSEKAESLRDAEAERDSLRILAEKENSAEKDRIRSEIEETDRRISMLNDWKDASSRYEAILESISEHEKGIALSERESSRASDELELASKAISLLSKDYQNYLADSTAESFRNVFNLFVRKLFPYLDISFEFAKSGIDMNFGYVGDSSSDRKASVKSLSLGQKSSLNVVYALTKAMLIGCPFMMLDEADGALTDENTVRLLNSLLDKAFDLKMFYISQHSRCIEEMDRIGECTLVRVENGCYSLG